MARHHKTKAILSLFLRLRIGRPARGRRGTGTGAKRSGAAKITERNGLVEGFDHGIGSGKGCGRSIWPNERSNPYIMDRFAAFRLQEVLRRPP